MSKTILVVDDEKALRELVRAYLTEEGFRVVTAPNGREALFVARYEKPDLIILDLMMPEMDGFDFIRVYSREAETPIIVLTAKLEESEKVLGLELGADDYVTKPFGMRELTARVRAVLRRATKTRTESDVVRLAGVTLDRAGRMVQVDGKRVDLTPSEFDILNFLISSPGRVFSRLDLLEQMQGEDVFDGYERTIDVHVRHLRKKIEPDPRNPIYIETVYGVGYRFAPDLDHSGEKTP
ncbi:MAG: response regulator transcription factor [Ardenticatenaceae bacterium]|nr:response regulator transcription factor [Ardenticatenaceae bacterium]